jgi:hypothetical protein
MNLAQVLLVVENTLLIYITHYSILTSEGFQCIPFKLVFSRILLVVVL